ncbi:MAG: hypothetical protein D6742_10240 [Cyanobacteria bacterium J069]|nr:MAG: hypothetical protein D6742_10240 [Cyanobacteria bacterium J069]
MKPIRQGDVILSYLSPAETTPELARKLEKVRKLPHLTLAEGEVTGHRHRIAEGDAELYERDGTRYLYVRSPIANLVHEEHGPIEIPQGFWQVRIQREYIATERQAPAPRPTYRPVSD